MAAATALSSMVATHLKYLSSKRPTVLLLPNLSLRHNSLWASKFPFLNFSAAPCSLSLSLSLNEDDIGYVVEEEEEDEHLQQMRRQAEDGRRLYIGNLPYSVTTPQLSQLLQECGTVERVEVVYDRMTDRSRGFGFVTMATAEDASNAIRMLHGSQLGGRTLKMNFPEVPRGGETRMMGTRTRVNKYVDSPHKVYVGNLAWSVTSEKLEEAFMKGGVEGVLGAMVVYEQGNINKSRGFGFVSFATAEQACSAVATFNATEVEGRPLRLDFAKAQFTSSTLK
ncbi:hypothetical protein AMTRI_Chr10g233540 [Amborella trichopoda]